MALDDLAKSIGALGPTAATRERFGESFLGSLLGQAVVLLGLVIAYIAALAVLHRYFATDLQGLRDTLGAPAFWALILAPAGVIVVFSMLPTALRAWRERRLRALELAPAAAPTLFRLAPYGPEDRASYSRPDGAEGRALKWITTTPASLLYLCGASGTGKSSLVAASLVPALADLGWATLSLRLGPDPAGSIRDGLLAAPDLVGRAPEGAPLADLLAQAARRREGKPPLLLVIDQFEEVLILNDVAQRKPLADLLHGLAKTPLPGLRLLLVFRSDYRELIFKLGLPDYVPQQNAFELAPFNRAEAEAFLRGAPILSGGYNDLFAGLDRVEDARGLYRPITLNMIGLVLGRMGARVQGDPARLIESYLRRCLTEGPSRDFAPQVLAPMITTAGTKEPQSLPALAATTRLQPWRLRSTLIDLSSQGLVRELGPQRWEISHDFLARQLGQILGRLRRPWLRRATPIALPLAALGWALLLFGALDTWPKERERKALDALNQMGFVRFKLSNGYGLRLDRPHGFANSDLRYMADLARNLRNLDELTTLDLSGADGVTDLAPLRKLPMLTTLDLSQSDGITDLAPLRNLHALTELDLSDADGIADLGPLRGLPTLTTLFLRNTVRISDLDPLRDVTTLTTLNLSNADGIVDLAPLSGLPELTNLDLSNADKIVDLSPVQGMKKLSILSVAETNKIKSLAPLRGLPALRKLDLSNADGITDLSPLQEISTLDRLNLPDADGITDLRPLRGLRALTVLDLAGANNVTDLEPLRDLPNLAILSLASADGITDLSPLRGLPLERLILSRVDKATYRPVGKNITTLAPLKGMDPAIIVGASPELLETMR